MGVTGLQLLWAGRQDCSDMHSFGPGMRYCYIIHYIIRGKGTYVVNGNNYPVDTGQSFLIIPYTTVHYYPDEKEPWEYCWIEFSGESVSEMLREVGLGMKMPVFPAIEEQEIIPYFSKAYELVHKRQEKEAIGSILSITGCISDHINRERDLLTENEKRLSNAISYIEAEYHREEFDIAYLCRLMNISRSTLYRLFEEEVGCSPSEYLIRYRVTQARKMLSKGASVKSAALSCGFDDPLYFSRLFYKVTGVRPSRL